MLDVSSMYKEESYTEDHIEVDGGEMIAGSDGSSFMPYTSASDKEYGVRDLGVLINLSHLIQVPKPSNRFTVTIDRSLINSLSVVPSSISSTYISLCGPSVSNGNSNPSNTIASMAAATPAVTITTVAVAITTAATTTTTTTIAGNTATTGGTITTTTTTTCPTPTTIAVPAATSSITRTCMHPVYPKFGLFQFTEPVGPTQVLPANASAMKFFMQMFDEDLFQHIVD